MDSETVQITRWRRYGRDRLYVTMADGTQLGYWDLVGDEARPVSPENLPTIVAAVEEWRGAQGTSTAPVVPAPVVSAPVPVRTQVEPVAPRPWLDLSTNEPGAEARDRATAARDAAPVKTLLARALGVHTDERGWRIGADGEELVAAQLAKMAKKDPRWCFIHAVPVGTRGSDIDHVVIGPGGVFTINSKHHPGKKIWVGGDTVKVDGTNQPYVRNSRHEAGRAATLLSTACGFPVHVEGLVVTVNAADLVVKSQPHGVQVVSRNRLVAWLLRHGDILDAETTRAVYDAARRSTTWQP